jgi:DNA polymerase (family 10)
MHATNAKVADLLRQYASALQLEGADRFKLKAYRRAAETLEALPEDLSAMVARGESLELIPGVGKAISAKIKDIVAKGKLLQLEKLTSKLPPELAELSAKPSLDPQKVLRIYKKLGIKSLAELQRALDRGKIRDAFGPKIDFHVRQGLQDRPRMLRWDAIDFESQVRQFLSRRPEVTRVEIVGSFRRRQDTVGDLNYLVTGKSASSIFKAFAKFGAVQETESLSRNKMRFRLSAGRTVTLEWTTAKNWGYAQIIATGSAEHVKELRAHNRKRFSIKALANDALTEEAVYEKLGLQYILPELRESRGEIEAAAASELPALVDVADIRGDLHMHTTASDGANSIGEMARAAQERGYQYIAIADHSQSLKITNGLTEKRLFAHIKAIDKLNARLQKFTILKSAEVDILEDGRLDYSNAALKELDLTICSIHSRFALDKEAQTERIMRAMDNPYFNILGHATGRLLLKREGYELDMERIIKHASESGCYFEINSSPDRLDLSDEHAKMAKDAGIKIAINTDAHSIRELNFISAGIDQARRGWLEKADVLNTYPLAKLKKLLRR